MSIEDRVNGIGSQVKKATLMMDIKKKIIGLSDRYLEELNKSIFTDLNNLKGTVQDNEEIRVTFSMTTLGFFKLGIMFNKIDTQITVQDENVQILSIQDDQPKPQLNVQELLDIKSCLIKLTRGCDNND